MSINTQAGPIIGGKEPSVILNPRLTSLSGTSLKRKDIYRRI